MSPIASHNVPQRKSGKNFPFNRVYISTINSKVGDGESVEIDGISVAGNNECVAFSTLLFKTPPESANLHTIRVSGYSMIPMLYPGNRVIVEISALFDGDSVFLLGFAGHTQKSHMIINATNELLKGV